MAAGRISLRSLALVLSAVTVALGLIIGFRQGMPDGRMLLVFACLMAFSEYRDIKVADRVSLGTGIMIGSAAIVVFHPSGTLLGPMLVAIAGGPDSNELRNRRWHIIALNAATGSLTLVAAGSVYYAIVPARQPSVFQILTGGSVASIAYLIACAVIFGGGLNAVGDARFTEVLHEMIPNWVQQIPFGLVGFLIGWLCLSLGPAVMLLVIVPILIAREMFASYMRVKEAHDETVQMLIHALEKKDRYTSGHSERVARYASYIGEELNFMPARMERLRFAALMHDIGKLVVPNHILNKPGRLTEEEFEKIKLHEKVGVQMLSHIDFLRPIAPDTHGDNMKFDPDDAEHPIEPYIIMIADAYDAMTSTRSYRKALPQEVAFQELRDKAGKQFHPECVEALIRAVEKRGEKHGAGFEEQDEFANAPDLGLGSAGLGDLERDEAQAS